MTQKPRLIVAMTGASGAHVTRMLLAKSPWPTVLIASRWGKQIYARECGPYDELVQTAGEVYDNGDLTAPPSSGSVPTAGMVVAPCSANTLGHIAAGLADSLITRAAHCQLKERRHLVLAVRETPMTTIDLDNAAKVAAAGATVMPLTPPYFMFEGKSAEQITLHDLIDAFTDRVLALLGQPMSTTWEDLR